MGFERKRILRKVTGYPASVEAMCLMIKNGETETAAFRFSLRYNGFDEGQAWEIYEAWCEKKIHPLAKEVMKKVFGVDEPI